MKKPQDLTRDNIRGKYGSIEKFARACGVANRRLVDFTLCGDRKGPVSRAILARLRDEGLLDKGLEGLIFKKVANGN